MTINQLNHPTYKTEGVNRTKTMRFHPFVSTGKERDEETGYSYFSARYLDHTLLTSFLSVDRYASKYPFISPYAYCAWNPIRLTDPTGDTIFNEHEGYRDVDQQVQNLTESMQGASRSERKAIKRKITELKDGNAKYNRVQGALDAFKSSNPEEYDRVNNLKVNIYVSASNDFRSSMGSMGETKSSLLQDRETGEIVGVARISITLYKQAFLAGSSGLSTLANEFGDAIFSMARSGHQYNENIIMQNEIQQGNKNYYYREPSSKFSFAYERYIMNPSRNPKPDPNDKEYN